MMEKSKKTGMNTVKTRHFVMIHKELEKACKKHPKFCDELTALDMGTVRAAEFGFKLVNSEAPYQADMILQEEIYEALAIIPTLPARWMQEPHEWDACRYK